MDQMKHTAEPWMTDETAVSGHVGIWDKKDMILICKMEKRAYDKANARRIVACVNALAGVSTERVDQLIGVTRGEADTQYATLLSHLSLLRGALERIAEECNKHGINGIGNIAIDAIEATRSTEVKP